MTARTRWAVGCGVVLALAAAAFFVARRKVPEPAYALEVSVVGHQYWWEFRYPQLGIVTANELHLPVGTATRMTMSSADVEHGFALPELSLSGDLNAQDAHTAWVSPTAAGVYIGRCAENCEGLNGRMPFRVEVGSAANFREWAAKQKMPGANEPEHAAGRAIFEHTACASCHTIAGTVASGRFGPDLTHVASRNTLAGSMPNTRQNLRAFIDNPASVKPGCLMPAMHLSPHDLDVVTDYIAGLK